MLTIYSPHTSPRFEYICKVLFQLVLKVPYEVTNSKDVFLKAEGVKIAYGEPFEVEDILAIPDYGLLWEQEIRKPFARFDISNWQELPTLFSFKGTKYPFDIFSASFYLITRYEEYNATDLDTHGRFKAVNALQYKMGAVDKPLVELWAFQLAKEIGLQSAKILNPQSFFKQQLTIDIDSAWVYKNYNISYTIKRIAKKLLVFKWGELFTMLKVLSGLEKDPGDSYNWIKEYQNKTGQKIRCFALIGNGKGVDKCIPHSNKNFQKLLKQLKAESEELGIHPSYASNSSFNRLKKEIDTLSTIAGEQISHSRQHFLKLEFPNTYRNLIKAGIKYDYTMGWAEQAGFRAGISIPFPFFDLEENLEKELQIIPFIAMDRTLKDYMSLSPTQAKKEVNKLIDNCKNIGGQAILLWHNTSLSDKGEWKGWKNIIS